MYRHQRLLQGTHVRTHKTFYSMKSSSNFERTEEQTGTNLCVGLAKLFEGAGGAQWSFGCAHCGPQLHESLVQVPGSVTISQPICKAPEKKDQGKKSPI